jgi:predicted aldo/keto reductase-like oxidoreductase
MNDQFGRKITYLRISVTELCNLRCRYCMPCPRGVDIPGIFAAYNRRASDGYFKSLTEYFMITGVRKDYTGPANCIGCGKCEQHCPQHIEIRGELKAAAGELETVKYKFMKTAIGVLKLW